MYDLDYLIHNQKAIVVRAYTWTKSYLISDCGKSLKLQHATVTYNANVTTVNHTATVNCNKGYLAAGGEQQNLTCLESGNWSPSKPCIVRG